MAKAKLMSIKELWGKTFFVPSYQRGFRWSTRQIEELLKDLYDFVKKKSGDYYCLQPIVVKKREENDEVWELVDGQQRLTALYIISLIRYQGNFSEYKRRQDPLSKFNYKLKYDKKEKFTKLIVDISKKIGEGQDWDDFLDTLSKECNDVDSINLIYNINHILYSFEYKDQYANEICKTILNDGKESIKVIWYELDDNEDAIQTFTNINANKISLTNAELIKALLLNSVSKFDSSQTNNVRENGSEQEAKNVDRQSLSIEWENIEKGLNDSSFWGFIVNENKRAKNRREYDTRIDYLFDIWYLKEKEGTKFSETDDEYTVFYRVNDKLSVSENKAEAVKEIWQDIKTIYETLRDWYSENDWYHLIGYLVAVNDKYDADLIKTLYNSYKESTKDDFRNKLFEKIKESIKGSSARESENPQHETEAEYDSGDEIQTMIENVVSEVSYSQKKEIPRLRRILLLYNIAILVNSGRTVERFPFDAYKNTGYDIEHINPQTPPENGEDEQKQWFDEYRQILNCMAEKGSEKCKNLLNELEKAKDLEAKSKIIENITNALELNSIGNLVLLDFSTNRSYGNATFSEKRNIIIQIERNMNKEKDFNKIYIPIGTKWVFLKGFEDAKQLIIWGQQDMEDYKNDIVSNISNLLGGKCYGKQ